MILQYNFNNCKNTSKQKCYITQFKKSKLKSKKSNKTYCFKLTGKVHRNHP